MNKVISSLALAALAVSAAEAQIPVTDVGSISTQIKNQVETIAKWKLQYDQMTTQINQLQRQYQALTASRGLGNIMSNPALRDYLPSDWQGVYDKVKSGGYSGLSGSGRSVYEANKIYDACAYIAAADERTACEARAVKPAQDKAFALDAYNAAKARIDQIDRLMGAINTTTNAKEIAELQARIAAEQANIQNEQTKLQLYSMVAAAEDRLQQQRQREMQARVWASRKGIQVEPIQFTHSR